MQSHAMSPVAEDDEKLRDVLQLFLLPDYNIVSTTYFDILLSHIAERIPAEGDPSNNSIVDILQKWISQALEIWYAGKPPCQALLSFTIKLVGLIGRNDIAFSNWYKDGTITKVCTLLRLREDGLPPSIKMAYTLMLLEFMDHESSRKWIIESGTWKDIIQFCHLNHTLYLTRESQKFVCKLLQHESENEEFCKEVILLVAAPLMDTFGEQLHPALEENYLDENKLLIPTIDLLTVILENTLFTDRDNAIPRLIQSSTDLHSRIKGLFETCISTTFFSHTMKLMYLLQFMMLKEDIHEAGNAANVEILKKFSIHVGYIHSMLIAKNYILDLVKAAKFILIYWKKLCRLYDFDLLTPLKVEHQCVVIMVLPLVGCIFRVDPDEDIVAVFEQKLFHITCEFTQRLCYMMRDIILKNCLPFEQIVKGTIQMILDTVDIMDRESSELFKIYEEKFMTHRWVMPHPEMGYHDPTDLAVIISQSMIYLLKQIVVNANSHTNSVNSDSPSAVNSTRSGNDNPVILKIKTRLDGDLIARYPILLSALLDGLATLTQKFKLKWQECLETICILSLSQDILRHPTITPKLCVQALTLSKVAIQNFMAPNLALLVNSESHMDEIGPVLYKRMHDPNWEVQDSVLELISTIATISEEKYPAFQDLLLNNGFSKVIVDIACSDGESYVRSTALTCIVTFVRIDKLWDNVLCHLNLPKIVMNILATESEAVVRREAAMLMKELYQYRKWPRSTIDEMVKTMAAAAVLDLHWEVKVNALEFWRQFIICHMSDQGMLDGKFPTVTFSKQHKKIVTLNEDEIKRRILKALDELASHNCLGVLLATLDDDSDFQVCKVSAEMINKMKDLFSEYKITERLNEDTSKRGSLSVEDSVNETLCSPENCSQTESSAKEPQLTKDVIDLIVNADDMNLLASVYNQTMNMKGDKTQVEYKKFEFVTSVNTNDFLRSILHRDIKAYMEEKNRWLKTYTNSFSSVIDDIITAHHSKNTNAMDCY